MDRRRFFVATAFASFSAALLPFRATAQDADAEFHRYTGSIVTLTSMLSWMLEEVGDLLTTSTEADYVNQQWRVDVLAPFAVAQAARDRLGLLTPPAAFSETHDLLIEAVDNLVISGEYMEQGVLGMDVAAINLANEHMILANDLTGQATEAMPSAALVNE